MKPPWTPQAESSQDAEKLSLIYFDKVFTRLPINSDGSPQGSPPMGGSGGAGGMDINMSSSMKSGSQMVGGTQFQGFSYMPTGMMEVSFFFSSFFLFFFFSFLLFFFFSFFLSLFYLA